MREEHWNSGPQHLATMDASRIRCIENRMLLLSSAALTMQAKGQHTGSYLALIRFVA